MQNCLQRRVLGIESRQIAHCEGDCCGGVGPIYESLRVCSVEMPYGDFVRIRLLYYSEFMQLIRQLAFQELQV